MSVVGRVACGYSSCMIHESFELEIAADWIARFHMGDQVVFERLYRIYSHDLAAYFAARANSRSLVDDLLQTLWMKVWNHRTSFRHGNFRSWLFRIARNELIDHWRRKYPELMGENFDPASPVCDQEDDLLDALRDCLDTVQGTFVEVVRGRTLGMSTAELATRFQIDASTVATRIHRGKQLLRECVEGKKQ